MTQLTLVATVAINAGPRRAMAENQKVMPLAEGQR
jgi:hypothetical protein